MDGVDEPEEGKVPEDMTVDEKLQYEAASSLVGPVVSILVWRDSSMWAPLEAMPQGRPANEANAAAKMPGPRFAKAASKGLSVRQFAIIDFAILKGGVVKERGSPMGGFLSSRRAILVVRLVLILGEKQVWAKKNAKEWCPSFVCVNR